MKNVILGAGQIANALKANINGESIMFDKGDWEALTDIDADILHICIPYSDMFTHIVETAERVFSPTVTIVHSTVKPGTSDKLKCLYSPVMGRHDDDFKNNVKLYRKFIAGDSGAYEVAKTVFNVTCEYWGENTTELEYSKIMSTSRMYWDLVYQKEIQRDCESLGFDFRNVYFRWTDNYNAGIRTNHPQWERPVFTKMDTEFPGGHCLKNNLDLLDNTITGMIKAWEKGIKYIVTDTQ